MWAATEAYKPATGNAGCAAWSAGIIACLLVVGQMQRHCAPFAIAHGSAQQLRHTLCVSCRRRQVQRCLVARITGDDGGVRPAAQQEAQTPAVSARRPPSTSARLPVPAASRVTWMELECPDSHIAAGNLARAESLLYGVDMSQCKYDHGANGGGGGGGGVQRTAAGPGSVTIQGDQAPVVAGQHDGGALPCAGAVQSQPSLHPCDAPRRLLRQSQHLQVPLLCTAHTETYELLPAC